MLAGSEVHMSDGECLLATTRLFNYCPLSFGKIVQMCGLLGSAAPKVDFIVIHGRAKPGTFESKMATC